jgi:alkylated DNA repair dioxygenase AlkB
MATEQQSVAGRAPPVEGEVPLWRGADCDAVLYERSFLDQSETITRACNEAQAGLESRPEIFVHGKAVRQPRDVGFFSDESAGYHYSRRVARAKPLTPALRVLLTTVNAIYAMDWNGVLVNQYNGGDDSIGDHPDSENGIDMRRGVLTLSFGAPRTFRIRKYVPGKVGPITYDAETKSCFALRMAGASFQKRYTHGIPKRANVGGKRISITFRRHLPEYEAFVERKIRADELRAANPPAAGGGKRKREADA